MTRAEASETPSLLGSKLNFLDYVWDRFDATQALNMLLTPSLTFFGQHEIMFAALGAWIVAPTDDNLRKAAIVRSIRGKLVKIEQTGTSTQKVHLEMADIVARMKQPKISVFYEHVYYPIGGLKTLTGSHSHPDFFKYYRGRTCGVDTAVEIAKIYHYHVAYLNSASEYRQASLNTAAPVVSVIGKDVKRSGGNAVDNIKKQWRSNRLSVAFAYAAAHMRFESSSKYSDLLHVMQSGDRAFRMPDKVVQKLVARAKFVEESILAKAYKNESELTDFSAFPDIECISFDPPRFDKSEREQIDRAFAKRLTGRMTAST